MLPFKAEHLAVLDLQDAQKGESPPWRDVSVMRSLEGPWSYTGFAARDGILRPVVAGGVLQLWPSTGLAWAFVGRDAGPHLLGMIKRTRAVFATTDFQRIEAHVHTEFKAGHRLVKAIGFRVETPIKRRNRYDGGDDVGYVMIRGEDF